MYRAFTRAYSGRVPVLTTEIEIFTPNAPESANVKSVKVLGIWDTGASGSVITEVVVKALGLIPVGMTKTKGVHEEKLVPQFLVDIGLPNRVAYRAVNHPGFTGDKFS